MSDTATAPSPDQTTTDPRRWSAQTPAPRMPVPDMAAAASPVPNLSDPQSIARAVAASDAQRRASAAQFAGTTRQNADQIQQITRQEMARPEVANTPPPKPPVPDPIAGFGSAASAFAMLASAFTHTPAVSAMNAMAGAINARNDGDWKQYAAKYKEWKDSSDLALKREAAHQTKWNEVIELMKTNISAGEAAWKAMDAEFGDEISHTLQLGNMMTQREQLGVSRAQLAQSWKIHVDELEQQKETVAHEKYLAVEHLKAHGVPETQALQQVEAVGVGQPGSTPYITMQVYQQLKTQHPELSDGDAWTQAVQRVKDAAAAPSGAAGKEKDARTMAAAKFKEVNGRDPGPQDEPEMARLRQTTRMDAAGGITDEAADFVAGRLIAGDERATVGMARSAGNMTKVTNAIVEQAKKQGLSSNDIAIRIAEFQGTVAGERTLGTRAANMEIAANVVRHMAPVALEASEKVDRTNYPTLNSVILAADRGTGDADVVRFGQAANAIIYEYSKFLNPTGIPTDADKARAADILNAAWSQGQFSAAIDQIVNKEIPSGAAGITDTRGEFRAGLGTSTTPPVAASPSATALPPAAASQLTEGHITTFANGQKWTLQNGKPARVP